MSRPVNFATDSDDDDDDDFDNDDDHAGEDDHDSYTMVATAWS